MTNIRQIGRRFQAQDPEQRRTLRDQQADETSARIRALRGQIEQILGVVSTTAAVSLTEIDAQQIAAINVHGTKGMVTELYQATLTAGLYRIHASAGLIDAGLNNRNTYVIRVSTENRTYYGSDTYIRDDANTYDSGLMAINIEHQATEGETIRVEIEVLDVQTSSGSVPTNPLWSNVYVDRFNG